MHQTHGKQNLDEAATTSGAELLTNILRVLCMLEKALDRACRRNYFNRSQYPEAFLEVEEALSVLRAFIRDYKAFCGLSTFHLVVCLWTQELGQRIAELMRSCSPVRGKRRVGKSRLHQEHKSLLEGIDKMLAHLEEYLRQLKPTETIVSIEFEKALLQVFHRFCSQSHPQETKRGVSRRGEKTYVFPCADPMEYMTLVHDRRRFRAEVVSKLCEYGHATGHKASCPNARSYHLTGWRPSPRKVFMQGGEQKEFPIRMIRCVGCGEKFSLLPSFLPREKHFGIEIIGSLLRGIFHFSQSLNAALENSRLTGKGLRSKQTLLNWIAWMGTLHPAAVLTRAGVTGSGYLQEDEGFEKEPDLRTYTVVMVDPENLLVWHIDYLDHVDEKTLCSSFEKFIERIDFQILGVTKDKWQPSTNALKSVVHRLWIGFCHRHCLKKIRKALSKYREETGCSSREADKLYNKLKKVLDTATSRLSMDVHINLLDDEAFKHPVLQEVLNEMRTNGAHYTSHKNRKGITRTTSLVDNFLKLVKRKLRQVESFRDQACTRLMFRAMANVRNFAPFMSGAKNAHKSPFMLAQGQTCDLPWIQVMNLHNAFLFADNAF